MGKDRNVSLSPLRQRHLALDTHERCSQHVHQYERNDDRSRALRGRHEGIAAYSTRCGADVVMVEHGDPIVGDRAKPLAGVERLDFGSYLGAGVIGYVGA